MIPGLLKGALTKGLRVASLLGRSSVLGRDDAASIEIDQTLILLRLNKFLVVEKGIGWMLLTRTGMRAEHKVSDGIPDIFFEERRELKLRQ